MIISIDEAFVPAAQDVRFTRETLRVDLSDGRTISVPLAWYPRLVHGTRNERNNWRLIGRGQGIHWKALDEDISVAGIIGGRPSGESQKSFKKWLAARAGKTKRSPARRSRARTR